MLVDNAHQLTDSRAAVYGLGIVHYIAVDIWLISRTGPPCLYLCRLTFLAPGAELECFKLSDKPCSKVLPNM